MSIPPREDNEHWLYFCWPLDVKQCEGVSYSSTIMPNFVGKFGILLCIHILLVVLTLVSIEKNLMWMDSENVLQGDKKCGEKIHTCWAISGDFASISNIPNSSENFPKK